MDGGLRQLIDVLSSWLEQQAAQPGFWSGVLVGVAALAIVAFFTFLVRVWWGGVTAPFRTQRVSHTTAQTPAQVSARSCRTLLLGVLVAGCLICLLVWYFLPGVFQALGVP